MKKRIGTLMLAAILVSLSSVGCDENNLVPIKEPESQTDLFQQKEAARVDILWVVDNSESMEAEQDKIADRFSQFFKQLLISQVNFHIGVVTSDPAENGVLRVYAGPDVSNCQAGSCRYITKDVPCPNPDVTFAPNTPEDQIVAGLQQECPAQLVFRKLIKVGVDGANYEQGLTNAALALGALIDPSTGAPQRDVNGNRIIPPENVGFIRDEASLYLIFVSDENDGSRGPTRYYYRLFEGLKYAGNENLIAISVITGWPVDNEGVNMGNICDILETGYDSDASNNDPNLPIAESILSGEKGGCNDPSDNGPNRFARVGGKFVELACRSHGVVADICSESYADALSDLGANAAGLKRKFEISKFDSIHFGEDCQPFTDDDPSIECASLSEAEAASPICVIATPLSGGDEVVVPRSPVSGWEYESSTHSIRFDGSFIPAPSTEVRISYRLLPSGMENCKNQ